MSPHDRIDDALRENAALFALGSLPPDEAASYEAHLAICDVCRGEVEALQPTIRQLDLSAPEVAPPAGLKDRLLQRIGSPGLSFVQTGAGDWEASGVPGVDVRKLFVDAAGGRQTILVRMHPGSSYPTHAHAGPEECYVVEGDLIDGPLQMRSGDYSRYDPGTQHGPLSTKHGCLLLVHSSLHDEVVDDSPPA